MMRGAATPYLARAIYDGKAGGGRFHYARGTAETIIRASTVRRWRIFREQESATGMR